MKQVKGEIPSDLKAFSKELNSFRESLSIFDKHLLMRNFLVDHSLTLADVYLVHVLMGPFVHLFDKKTRMTKLPNLTRFLSSPSSLFTQSEELQ